MLSQLNSLPRDKRDTLFLLAVIAWVILPQAANLPLWCTATTTALLATRAWLTWHDRPLPPPWVKNIILAITIGANGWTHGTLVARDAGVTLIVILLALKTLEMRGRRDAFVVFFLGFFTMLTNFFFSQSLVTAVAMLVAMLGLMTALVNAHMPVGSPPLMRSARAAGAMALLGAPIMLVLFVLFPRVGPLWGVPEDALSGRSGLSNTMQVGNIAKLALDDGIALRVKFEGDPPAQSTLYFRGPVLSRFDGREWQAYRAGAGRNALKTETPADQDIEVHGQAIRYQITQEPGNRPWMMVLDVAPQAPQLQGISARQTPDLQWLADRPLTELTRYSAQSYTDFRYGVHMDPKALRAQLDLPEGYNPRTLQLAAEMRRQPALADADGAKLVQAVLERLRSGGYVYTLEPGVFGKHTADEFWFDRRQGFCEHIASSFVVLMRALGVPARVVTGFQGGSANTIDGMWTVRNSDAHAWAEVWLADQGWTRVDPTSSVAPGRTGSFDRLTAPRSIFSSVFSSAFGTVSPTLIADLRALWEATNNSWNQWVLNYTQGQQLHLLRNLGFDDPDWQDLGQVLIGVVVLASLLGAAWARLERRRTDPWLNLLRQIHQRLKKRGVQLPESATPRATIAAVAAVAGQTGLSPELVERLSHCLIRLEKIRYAKHAAPLSESVAMKAEWRDLRAEFRALPWPKARNAASGWFTPLF